MKKQKYLLILILILLSLLTSCINTSGPNYIDSIDIYINGEITSTKLKYFDDSSYKWKDYSKSNKEVNKVYVTANIYSGDEIEIVFNFYNPKIEIKEVMLVSRRNKDYSTNERPDYEVFSKVDNYTKVVVNVDSFDNSFNMIELTSWLTNNGIKYQSRKGGNNYAIWGVHFEELERDTN